MKGIIENAQVTPARGKEWHEMNGVNKQAKSGGVK